METVTIFLSQFAKQRPLGLASTSNHEAQMILAPVVSVVGWVPGPQSTLTSIPLVRYIV